MNILISALSLSLIISHAYTLNILGIFPYEGKSHFMQFKVYLEELANRGHNVTVISYFPNKNPLPNYKDIMLGDGKILSDEVVHFRSYLTLIMTGIFLTKFGINNCRTLVSNEQVRDLVARNPKFDVVVVEQFNSDCALGIAYKLGAPVVGITSHVLMPYHYKRLGIPNNPAYVPSHFLSGGSNPSLYQRVERVIFDFYFGSLYTIEQWIDGRSLAEYYDDIPPLEELAREIKFMLLYQNFVLTGSRLYPSNVIEIGGYSVQKAKPLTGDLKRFIEGAEQGVVYMSFGSMLLISDLSNKTQEDIYEVAKEFPQRFILKYGDKIPDWDKNKFYTEKWLPQIDILAHPKTMVFIGHGGMGSTVEALHYGVPMIVSPFFGDQPANAASVEESGFGVVLEVIDKESLRVALKKVLDPTFRTKALNISQMWHDRPMSALDTAVYWTEFAARHSNFTFRTPAADIPLYQHWNIDIAVIFTIIFLTLAYVTKSMISLTSRKSPKSSNTLETKNKGKKKSKRE